MASSILQLLTSSYEAGKNAASSVVGHAKASSAKEQDASLFSIAMGGCMPSRQKTKPQPRDLPTPSERSSNVETRHDVTNDADSADSDVKNLKADASTSSDAQDDASADQHASDDAHAKDAADPSTDLQDVAADAQRDGDIVDVPEGYAENAASDPTKDPLSEALAMGLLVGQAVPVNQLPQAAGSFAVAVDAALAAPVNAPASPLIAQPAPSLPINGDFAANLDVAANTALPEPHVADAALTALVTASLMDQAPQLPVTSQAVAPVANVAQATTTGAVAIPAALVNAPQTTPEDDAAIAQALETLAQADAAPVAADASPVSDALPNAAPGSASADAVKTATVPAPVMAQTLATNEDAATEDDAAAPVAIEPGAVGGQAAPKRLGKVAPAALKALGGQPDADPLAEKPVAPAAPAPLKNTAPEAPKEHMAALGSNPAGVRAPIESVKVAAAPVVGVELASATTSGNTISSGSNDAASGLNGLGGAGFASTLQNAVQLPGAQAALRGGVAEQIAAQISALPKNKGTQFTLQLTPDDLGKVDVVMDFHKNGHVQLTIRADSQEALTALQRDAQALERNLQDLGLKTDSGSLQFSLRQDQGGQASQFGDAQRQSHGQQGQPFGGRNVRNESEETTPIAQVNYRVVRSDGNLDIQV